LDEYINLDGHNGLTGRQTDRQTDRTVAYAALCSALPRRHAVIPVFSPSEELDLARNDTSVISVSQIA